LSWEETWPRASRADVLAAATDPRSRLGPWSYR